VKRRTEEGLERSHWQGEVLGLPRKLQQPQMAAMRMVREGDASYRRIAWTVVAITVGLPALGVLAVWTFGR
jgi:hypothetical protein